MYLNIVMILVCILVIILTLVFIISFLQNGLSGNGDVLSRTETR